MAVAMGMAMVVPVAVLVANVVMVVLLMIMMVIGMMVAGMGPAIGAALGIEWRFNFLNRSAEAKQHVADHVVASEPDRSLGDLRRQVTVADLPGKRQEVPGVPAPHLHQLFRFGTDLDDAAIIKHQPVAMAQKPRLRQIEQEGDGGAVFHAVGHHAHPAAMPCCFIERYGRDGTFKRPCD